MKLNLISTLVMSELEIEFILNVGPNQIKVNPWSTQTDIKFNLNYINLRFNRIFCQHEMDN